MWVVGPGTWIWVSVSSPEGAELFLLKWEGNCSRGGLGTQRWALRWLVAKLVGKAVGPHQCAAVMQTRTHLHRHSGRSALCPEALCSSVPVVSWGRR